MQSKEVICPILERATRVRPIAYGTSSWQLVECQETGFVFLLNPPTYQDLTAEFAWEKTFAHEKKRRQVSEPIMAHVSQLFRRVRTSVFPNRDKTYSLALRHAGTKSSLQLLDVGSGLGHRVRSLCHSFKERGIDVVPHGIEISGELAAISNSMFERLGGSVVTAAAIDGIASFHDKAFDVVVMQCYLEHEVRPLEVLRRTRSVLREEGVILIKVPNYKSINRWLRGARWCGFRFPDHVNYFTPNTLRRLANEAGCEMMPQRFWDCPPTSDNMYAVLRNPLRESGDLRHAA